MSADEDIPARLCPVCSIPPHCAFRPAFYYMRKTSLAEGRDCHYFRGCSHVDRKTTRTDEERIAAVVAWNEKAEQLFVAKTASWPDESRESLREQLETFNP